jgi:hypothetical protein
MSEASDAAYRKAAAYISAAPDKTERRRRKDQVFHVIYGNDAAREAWGRSPAAAGLADPQAGTGDEGRAR